MKASQIRKVRKELNWTQARLAEWMGVTIRTIQNWEKHGCPKSVWLALQGISK